MNKVPSLCKHKRNGQGYVTIDGKQHFLGKYGTEECIERYNRKIAEWQAGIEDPNAITISELCLHYLKWAERYYVKNGEPTSMIDIVKMSIKTLRKLYGRLDADEFSPSKLRAIQSQLIDRGLTRGGVNRQVTIIKKIFKHGVAYELCDQSVHNAISTVDNLQRGRTEAPDNPRVKPVEADAIDKTLDFCSRDTADMIQLQLLTGMRPGEVVALRIPEIDRSGEIWTWRYEQHKNAHRGTTRIVYFGPKAQEILTPYLFQDRPFPIRRNTYGWRIAQACERAGIPSWTANQLRHSAGTWIRKHYGLEAAQVILGHSKADVTQLYAEANEELALRLASKLG